MAAFSAAMLSTRSGFFGQVTQGGPVGLILGQPPAHRTRLRGGAEILHLTPCPPGPRLWYRNAVLGPIWYLVIFLCGAWPYWAQYISRDTPYMQDASPG
jgi:hypothetical protein